MSRQSTFIPLENVRVASPCRADWNLMDGDERARFCQTCAKNVYNLSDMSRAQAEALIQEKEGNLCVRFYRRQDGTIITDNCPVGLRAVRRPFQWLAAGFVALIGSGIAIVNASTTQPNSGNTSCPPRWGLLQPVQNWWIARTKPKQVMGKF